MKFIGPALLLLSATPALANPPAYLPTRDVSITYNLSVPGHQAATYQLAYDAASQRARIDDPAQGTYFLVNLPDGTAQLVVPALHSTVNAPDLSALTRQINTAGQARFTALGPGYYAGLTCEKYLVLNDQGTGTACLTPDGVVLHFTGHDSHGSADVTATSVTYQHTPVQMFAPPQGNSSINLPPGILQQLLGK
ncbi:MAG: hypothetical protein POG74_03090 [Acidocella sp.]|nr:hypothetical protein [Acidocella sp.]